MGKFYRLFQAPRTVFCVICCILVTILSCPALAAPDSVFTVEGVSVDVTAENAAAAREQAFAEAQTMAFQQLADRLLSGNQMKYFVMPEASAVSLMIKDFEITQEQLSNVRYVGTYTFRFQGDVVRNYLGSNGFSYTDVGSKPVLVLPFYQWGSRFILWDEDNPWLKAWGMTRLSRGLVPVIIPIGDAQDVSDIGDQEALTFDPEKLTDMTARYNAGEAVIMVASPEWSRNAEDTTSQFPEKLIVTIYRTANGVPDFSDKLEITNQTLSGEETIFTKAVEQSRQNLQQVWKDQTLVNAAQGNILIAKVRFSSMQEWVETQKKLRRVQGINDMKLLSLSQGDASVQLRFQGTEDRLRLALAQADMTLGHPQSNYRNNPYRHTGDSYDPPLSAPVYDLYINKYVSPY
ncbi:MAG: DUF2066 domain-containing protein [Alphaproteobacteria bacterium CG_4_9_14_3_um_filter_47_13]|nr:MAG: DUF2066 domain-containing protein [Alphaproteobacteria bacterium CG_4_9_14_3_um_filter_47_13]